MKTAAESRELARWLAATDLGLLELVTSEGTLRLGRDPLSGTFVQLQATQAATLGRPLAERIVTAASVGVFRVAHPIEAVPLAPAGAQVATGQPIGLLQVGPLLLPVPAPCDGRVAALQVADGAGVGYGQPLVTLRLLNP